MFYNILCFKMCFLKINLMLINFDALVSFAIQVPCLAYWIYIVPWKKLTECLTYVIFLYSVCIHSHSKLNLKRNGTIVMKLVVLKWTSKNFPCSSCPILPPLLDVIKRKWMKGSFHSLCCSWCSFPGAKSEIWGSKLEVQIWLRNSCWYAV